MMAFAIAPISRTPFHVKGGLTAVSDRWQIPSIFGGVLFDDGCEDGQIAECASD
jgi:hypothetical protein